MGGCLRQFAVGKVGSARLRRHEVGKGHPFDRIGERQAGALRQGVGVEKLYAEETAGDFGVCDSLCGVWRVCHRSYIPR